MQLRRLHRVQLAAPEDNQRRNKRSQASLNVLNELDAGGIGGYPVEHDAVKIIAPDNIERLLGGPDVDEFDIGRADKGVYFLTQGLDGGYKQDFFRARLHGMLDDAKHVFAGFLTSG